ncbi:MAG: hypothetical protein JXB85_04765 [Anaerolineales bacterium]|nr:hypothetical protein [Anaerolineales bacterium]
MAEKVPQGAEAQKPRDGQLSPPAISLPKGGGAIRGIGEKFSANPTTGTGSISVPLVTSPGRQGFGPQLSISYDSGSGNAPFGLGWNLSLPCITRKTDKGLPRYRNQEESDVFILSGAEDLVPVLEQSGGGWQVMEKTRQVGGISYTVKRYRPRVEGLFARIERWTNKQTDEVHWRSISKDNITTCYGKTAASRIADPADPIRIFSWLICESYDDKGNAIYYEYKAEDSNGVEILRIEEKNRTASSRSAQRYPKRIRYGNLTPRRSGEDLSIRTDWLFEVVFDYGEHLQALPADAQGNELVTASSQPQATWEVRPDPFSSYRAGFELRTYRLCQRVLMFHHFPNETVGTDCLVSSTDLEYEATPFASYLVSVTHCGYVRKAGSQFLRKSLPPVEFEFSQFQIDETVRAVDPDSIQNLPAGLAAPEYIWVDLDGEGLSGILSRHSGAWYYKRNLSRPQEGGNGSSLLPRFGPLERVVEAPVPGNLPASQQQFLDLAGDGQLDLVQFAPPLSGYFERTAEESWEKFVPFRSLPNTNFQDPNLRFVDLTGDGHADILITEDESFTWYASLAEAGFEQAGEVRQAVDEEKGPRLLFADGTQSIYLADMSGDGLIDLVRIRNGEVCYWPNLGYGRFGARVSMADPPVFDEPDQFEQKRIHLADIDGSGTTDILYVKQGAVHIWRNQSGNGWGEASKLDQFPLAVDITSLSVLDLLGSGTACLVWSSPLPADANLPMRYIDLMGGEKPHLLVGIRNNLGAETCIRYAPSTRFYIEDRLAGHPWITRLPFPVHVVERVETFDRISRNFFVTRYAYHHGYFDGAEREFRGFGLVETWDTEEFNALKTDADVQLGMSTNLESASHVPPVLTRTWFHTGASKTGGATSKQFEEEYYSESDLSQGVAGLSESQLEAMLLDDTVLPSGLSAEEERQACRALKGSTLRQEIYALDGSEEQDRPYSVSERNFTIECLQPLEDNHHAVFFTHPRETLNFHYERKLYEINGSLVADPRVSHAMVLSVDDYGNVLQSVSIGYGRRFEDTDSLLTSDDKKKQARTLITYAENSVTSPVDEQDAYRAPLQSESRTRQLLGITPAASQSGVTNLFRFTEMAANVLAACDGAHDLPYEPWDVDESSLGAPSCRLIEHVRQLYYRDDLSSPLALGDLESLGLPYESYKLAFTPALITQIYASRVTDTMLSGDGAFVHSEGDANWWIPSGKPLFSADAVDHFYLPTQYADPFGNKTSIKFDAYDLLLLETEDALQNKTTVGERDAQGNITPGNDYRLLQPTMVTDPNGNRSAVTFDAVGMVVGTAVMGKAAETRGDSLTSFKTDLDQATVLSHLQDPLINPEDILEGAATRLVYDLFAYQRTQGDPEPQPAVVYTLARETHQSDLAAGQQIRIQHSLTYSDGFGREIQKKVQAEPGPFVEGGADVNPRWVGSGWTIFNNKGKPVRKYEPFFSSRHEFEFARQEGVSPILFYDPLDRVIATLHPNQAYDKVIFDPWRQESWDVNDNVLQIDPALDTDVGNFFQRLPQAEYLPTWYARRSGGGLGAEEQSAASKAAAHAKTPTFSFFDALGQVFLTVADNGTNGQYTTRNGSDIEGNLREAIDALDRIIMRYKYDILGSRIHQESMEAGERWTLNNAAGKPVYTWDSRGHRLRNLYDELQRPTEVYMRQGSSTEMLVERVVYGENRGDALNHRGKVFRHYDGSGFTTNEEYDFKGNLLHSNRRLAADYTATLDWLTNVTLEEPLFTTRTNYDALNRPVRQTMPDRSVIQVSFNEANLLEGVEAYLHGDATATTFVSNVDYNAKGQRTLITYGNGAQTEYDYDPDTFRLIGLKTTRPASFPAAQRVVQDLSYVYDPAGNITSIEDDAQQVIFFNNQVVKPDKSYTYDSVYRLIEAKGREHIGQQSQPQPSWNDGPHIDLPHPNDGQAMRSYTEQYTYDQAGNILKIAHQASNGNWSRVYSYNEPSLLDAGAVNNRLSQTTVGSLTESYSFDAHGNMTAMPHLSQMTWDFENQLQMVDPGGGNKAYYTYDASGQRIRKVCEHGGASVEERLYLGGYEIYRKSNALGVELEREALHIVDDRQGIALVERRTQGNDGSPARLIRYQCGDHLGSVNLEMDSQAQVVSYEEYYPYGSTSFQAVESQMETPKRYRYMGKERDEDTGLYYCGTRYLVPWLGRWCSCDPKNLIDELNLYIYVSNNPLKFRDPGGGSKEYEIVSKVTAKAGERTFYHVVDWGGHAPEVPGYSAKGMMMANIQHKGLAPGGGKYGAGAYAFPTEAEAIGLAGGAESPYAVFKVAPDTSVEEILLRKSTGETTTYIRIQPSPGKEYVELKSLEFRNELPPKKWTVS